MMQSQAALGTDEETPSWCPLRLKFVFREVDERRRELALPLLSLTKSRGLVDAAESGQRASEAADYGKYKVARPGDMVMNKMQAWNGIFGLCTSIGIVSPDYTVFRPQRHIDARYFEYLLRTPRLAGEFFVRCRGMGTAFLRLNTSDFGDVVVGVPSEKGQCAIADFLDRETAKIDTLIEKQERLIELLEEKRQAVITRAVTKGLNPDVRMKDSGVEWLGEVPEHWDQYPLKHLLRLKHGYAFDGNRFSDVGDFILMTPGNFKEGGGFRAKIPEKYYVGNDIPSGFVLEGGQLLVAMTEQAPGLIGSALFVPAEGTYLHNQRLGLVINLRSDRITSRFLFHFFNSSWYRAEVGVTATGTKVRHTSPEKMLSIRVALPPIEEQEGIVEHLDRVVSKVRSLSDKSRLAIKILRERRTALISAAVTGKIDVRQSV